MELLFAWSAGRGQIFVELIVLSGLSRVYLSEGLQGADRGIWGFLAFGV